ncbi:MAG TPA: protein kinase [Candidatus Sulfotelmatobacter sp.]|nr:protein kinase [Candidatus Sulfotelmatobacter sp.]
MVGRVIGHYRILEKIGAGGMGEIYRARDERLGRDVALKLIGPASSENPDHLRRFEQEARAAASLNHPNIVAIYDVGTDGNTPYIVSELLEGKNLRQRLAEGSIPVQEALNYARQMIQGLIAAHDRQIVHRDLKPENLFLTTDGRVKILDFGVAKLQSPPSDSSGVQNLPTVTKAGGVIGTVAYMSPEQLRGKSVDHRSDLFSVGAILYEMFSGERAFRGETDADTMTAVLREEPPEQPLQKALIPVPYQEVIQHCLEKNPEDRFQSAKDLNFAFLTLTGASGKSGFRPQSFRMRSRGSLLPWLIAAGLAVIALAALFVPRSPAPPPSYHRVTFESGTVYSARFTADGQSIVYSAAWNGRPVQLFSTVGNSLLAQGLNVNGTLLAISPANDLAVVLGGTHSGQLETINGMLAISPLAGGSPREVLSDVRWADWDATGQLAVVHSVEGHSRLEFPVGHVLYQSGGWISHIRFSPRGDKIAFLDHPALWDNRGTVCVVDLKGQVRTLSPEWESEHGLAWRHDGSEIWFSAVDRGNSLNLMATTLKGKIRNVLTLPVGTLLQDVAADGRVLVSLTNKRLAMGFASTDSKEDVDLSWHDWDAAHDIARDNKAILFEDASEAAGAGYVVALLRLDGTLPIRLGEGSSGGLSPDGKWAIAISVGKAPEVRLLPTGPGEPRTVDVTGLAHVNNGFARFLEDGRRITLDANEAGHAVRCWLLDISGGQPRPITPEGTLCGASSPDGRYVIGFGPNSSIALYAIDGGTPPALPHFNPQFHPVQWSADGSLLFGYHYGELPSRIYKVEIASGRETLLKELRPEVPAGVVLVAPVVVSRDGTHVAYSYNQTLSMLYTISGLQ